MKKFEKGGMPETATPIKSDFSQTLKIVSPRCLHYTVCEVDLKNQHAIAVPECWFANEITESKPSTSTQELFHQN